MGEGQGEGGQKEPPVPPPLSLLPRGEERLLEQAFVSLYQRAKILQFAFVCCPEVKMSFISWIYRNGLWISVPLFVISAALLAFFILNIVRGVRQAHLLSVPLREQQEIEFAKEGRVVLCTQGPLLSFRFANLDYELTGDGLPVEGRTTWFHSRTSGLSWVRMEMKIYTIPRPGRYNLRIKGLQPGLAVDPEHKIVFMRPHLARSIANVIGIVLTSLLFIGSIVLFSLRLSSKAGGT